MVGVDYRAAPAHAIGGARDSGTTRAGTIGSVSLHRFFLTAECFSSLSPSILLCGVVENSLFPSFTHFFWRRYRSRLQSILKPGAAFTFNRSVNAYPLLSSVPFFLQNTSALHSNPVQYWLLNGFIFKDPVFLSTSNIPLPVQRQSS